MLTGLPQRQNLLHHRDQAVLRHSAQDLLRQQQMLLEPAMLWRDYQRHLHLLPDGPVLLFRTKHSLSVLQDQKQDVLWKHRLQVGRSVLQRHVYLLQAVQWTGELHQLFRRLGGDGAALWTLKRFVARSR